MSELPRTMTALKPCPFCGGKSELIEAPEAMNEGAMVVECQSCHASGPCVFGVKEDPNPIAIDCWNRRAAHDSSEQTIRETQTQLAKSSNALEAARVLSEQQRQTIQDLRQQVDMLLGKPDAVHLGAQAAVTALRQCHSVQAECDWLRSQRDELRTAVEAAAPMIKRERELSDQLAAALKQFTRGEPWGFLSCCKHGPTKGCQLCGRYYEARAALSQHAGMRSKRSSAPAIPEDSQPAWD